MLLYDSPALTAYLLLLTALLGLVMGSFLNCLAWRLAHGEAVSKGRSHCPACGHTLAARDLIPLFSWLLLRGRCRYCGGRISPRYPAAELVTALAYVSVAARYGLTLDALRGLVLLSLLIAASLVDLEEGWIPDRLVLAGIGAFVLLALPDAAPLAALGRGLFGALAVTLPLLALVLLADRLLGRETMGGGDIKLLFMLGLYFDWRLNLLLLIAACLLGLMLALILGRARPGAPFPFGPALAAAAWFVLLAGRGVLDWYLGLFF